MRFDLADAVAILESTPHTLHALLAAAPSGLTHAPYGPSTWSAAEVVAHLIFGERTDWMPRLRLILAGSTDPFPPFDRAGHAPLLRHALPELLDLFKRERAASLADLHELHLTDADLDRQGVHPAFGPVTARQLLATWVVHDLNHIAQCCKAMAFQYRTQVGPWEAYLSILAPPNPR